MQKGRSSRVDGRTQAMMAGLLQDRIVRRIPHPQRSVTPSPSTRISHTHTHAQCSAEREIRPGTHQPLPKLAQGLVAASSSRRRLSVDEWTRVKFRSLLNGNCTRPCAVCNTDFRLQPQVLLSCSHAFHMVCLRKLEISSGRKCPQCGMEQYETRVIDDGARVYREKCALRIQAWWRGCITRRWYQDMRKVLPLNDPQFHCRFFKKKVQEINENVLQMLHMDLDALLQDMDMNIAHFRHIMQQYNTTTRTTNTTTTTRTTNTTTNTFTRTTNTTTTTLTTNTISTTFSDMKDEWSEAQEKALQRDTRDCPICLNPLRSLKVVLLSCSHLFHGSCLREFESSCVDQDATCPLCRRHYVSAPVHHFIPPSQRLHSNP